MSNEMQIDVALANLEAGRFSFRTVEAVRSHLEKLERELAVLQELHGGAIQDLKRREYAVWRLEAELTRSNARVHALLKANMLTEAAYRHGAAFAHEARVSGERFLQLVVAALSRAAAELRDPELWRGLRQRGEKALDEAPRAIGDLRQKVEIRLAQAQQSAEFDRLRDGVTAFYAWALASAQKGAVHLESARSKLKARLQDAA